MKKGRKGRGKEEIKEYRLRRNKVKISSKMKQESKDEVRKSGIEERMK